MKSIILVALSCLLLCGCSRGSIPAFTISAADVVTSSVRAVNTARIVPGKPPSDVRHKMEVHIELSDAKAAKFRHFVKHHFNQSFRILIGTNVYSAYDNSRLGVLVVGQPGERNILAEPLGTNLDLFCSSPREAHAISDSLSKK